MVNYKMVGLASVFVVLFAAGNSLATGPTYQAEPPTGVYLASGIADASGSGGEAYVEYWVWDGGNGYYYYTYRVTNTVFQPFISFLTINNSTREMYYITGCSGGWNPATGAKGNAWSASSPITQIAVIQWASNDSVSNIYPGFSSWGPDDGQLFQFASQLPPSCAGFTLMQGDTSINASGLIAAPGSSVLNPRSSGYWKHQTGTKGERKEADSVPGYLNVINPESGVFQGLTVSSSNVILQVPDNSDMREKAKKELLALWMNVVSSKLNYTAELTFKDPDGTEITKTPQQVISEVEATILNAAATLEELEYAKDIAEILNNL
jgi:hypothetical protein